MMAPDRHSGIAPEDMPYITAYITAANRGQSTTFVGIEVVASLILSVRDLAARIKELEGCPECGLVGQHKMSCDTQYKEEK